MKGIVIIGSLIIVLSLFSSLSEARTSYGFVTSDGTIISGSYFIKKLSFFIYLILLIFILIICLGSGDYTTSAASNCNNDVCGVLYNISFTTPYTKTPVATANGISIIFLSYFSIIFLSYFFIIFILFFCVFIYISSLY